LEEKSMAKRLMWVVAAGLLAMLPTVTNADNLSGADRILCTAVQATICESGGECEIGLPWLWNIPQFVVVDLEAKTLGTTKASGENRVTPIKNLQRAEGMIFLQGIEAGRAFSFAIQEETGRLSAAIARQEITVSVFGACTPLEPQGGKEEYP
jgi:hypothetical protein